MGRVLLLYSETLLNIGFKDAEDRFMALNRHLQRSQQSLGRVEIHNDPLLDMDRILWNSNGLGIQTKVNNELFWRACNAAEIRIKGDRVFIFHLDLDRLRLLALSFLCCVLFYFARHKFNLQEKID